MMPRRDEAAGPTPLQWFLSELRRAPGCPATKGVVLDLLRAAATQTMYLSRRDLAIAYRVEVARRLLNSGATAAEARRRVAQRFGVSADTAERAVRQALQQRPEVTRCET